MKVALKRTAIATSTVACVALLSFSWSEQRGVSLGVESAQGADRSTVGVARRQYRRGYGVFAAAVAATTSPWNYDDYYCYGIPYTGGYYYRSYPGGYCLNRSDVTGFYTQPTLFPRYYGAGAGEAIWPRVQDRGAVERLWFRVRAWSDLCVTMMSVSRVDSAIGNRSGRGRLALVIS
jgi:hypothetical protein